MAAAVKSVEKWQELGHQLNISPEMLSNLFNSGQSGAECRDEMVAYWEKHDNDASWEKLARALARMGENQLAEGIIKEHSLPKTTLVPKEEQATNPKNEGQQNLIIYHDKTYQSQLPRPVHYKFKKRVMIILEHLNLCGKRLYEY